MAGLWDVWEGPEGPMCTYTILTPGRHCRPAAGRAAALLRPPLSSCGTICSLPFVPAFLPAGMPLATAAHTSHVHSAADSSTRLEWLHDRMPVILRGREAQQVWLDTTDPAAMG